ncbi:MULTISPECIES: glycosyltransferase family 4 protein [Paraburkholderia]|jgi:glycosyltransferase involved in cell wall biosynthesis|uniref:glycosyltransferase family 4 protein n=1 Tax=Paraburkholderia TaxID=1822464 RepID=UPI002258A3B5|nr:MULTISPECIES: glycosyltransferase family 4 protein [Paraburkholderia]MCX4175799.1 glycosyltransferase family 4 protein [Paraburkholderia madseniana]MDQ6463793.1 glycosyltransferase family 4 protein [Paraburkholderia madseniana]
MKITFILPKLTRHPTGGGKIVYQYANAMANAGHSIEVLHPETLFLWGLRKNLFLMLLSLAADCARLLRGWMRQRAAIVPWMKIDPAVKISVVPALFSRYIPNADVVVASLWRTAEYVENYPACKGAKFYFVQHHETWSGPERRVNQTLRSRTNKIVISGWLGDLVKDLSGVEAQQVPNPVDHDEFFPTSPIASRRCVVSMLYSPHTWKGAADGVSALDLAKRQFPDLEAILFGVSPRPEALPGWIKYVQNPEKRVLREEIYNASSIYLCPSWTEGWGLPVLEAMACGCAIVTSDNGGTRDFVVNGVNGLVVAPQAPRALGEALTSLLANAGRRTSFAARSVVLAQQFTLQASVSKFLTALENRPAAEVRC